ncbi:hypothetical protein WME77_36855 [Sorangium sp. So ce764]|uniref:hypothetical protein n=1 Tax=Sorangium sp. So ce764 TaxID=3133320 RepID=UPI003F61C039
MRGPRPATWVLSGTALFLLLFAPAAARAAAPPERSRPVKELIREAEAAEARLDIARARALWAVVHEIDRSNVAVCAMGQLDARMDRWAQAVVELSQCVDEMPAPRTEEERSLYERRHADLARAQARVGEVVLVPAPGIVGMLVNGGGVKHGSSRVHAPPSQHEVTAVGGDGHVARATVKVGAGESKPVPLTFDEPAKPALALEDRAKAPEGAPEPRAPRPAAPKGPPQGVARPGPDLGTIVMGALSSAGLLAASAVCTRSAQRLEQEAKAAEVHEGKPRIAGATPPPDSGASIDDPPSAKLMRVLGTGALLAGATAGVGTLLYVVLPNDTQIAAGTAGVGVSVRW